jgi:hypothetical protein
MQNEINRVGDQAKERLRALVEEGNRRRLIVRTEGGEPLVQVPLTLGVIVGGIVTLVAPVLAVVGAIAALVARVKVDVTPSENS